MDLKFCYRKHCPKKHSSCSWNCWTFKGIASFNPPIPKLQNSVQVERFKVQSGYFRLYRRYGVMKCPLRLLCMCCLFQGGARGEGSRWHAILWGMKFNLYIYSVDLWRLHIILVLQFPISFTYFTCMFPHRRSLTLKASRLGFYSNSRL